MSAAPRWSGVDREVGRVTNGRRELLAFGNKEMCRYIFICTCIYEICVYTVNHNPKAISFDAAVTERKQFNRILCLAYYKHSSAFFRYRLTRTDVLSLCAVADFLA